VRAEVRQSGGFQIIAIWIRLKLVFDSGRGAVWFSALDWGSRGRRFKSCRPDSVGDDKTLVKSTFSASLYNLYLIPDCPSKSGKIRVFPPRVSTFMSTFLCTVFPAIGPHNRTANLPVRCPANGFRRRFTALPKRSVSALRRYTPSTCQNDNSYPQGPHPVRRRFTIPATHESSAMTGLHLGRSFASTPEVPIPERRTRRQLSRCLARLLG
jgi:hypothetical protein